MKPPEGATHRPSAKPSSDQCRALPALEEAQAGGTPCGSQEGTSERTNGRDGAGGAQLVTRERSRKDQRLGWARAGAASSQRQ